MGNTTMKRRQWLGDTFTVLICIGIFVAIVILSVIEAMVRAAKRRVFDEPLEEWQAAAMICGVALIAIMFAT